MTSPFLPVQVDLPGPGNQTEDAALAALFAEELGLMLEVSPQQEQAVLEAFKQAGVPVRAVGSVTADPQVAISVDGQQQITGQSFSPCGLPASRQDCRDAMWGRVRGCWGGRAALTVDGQQQLTSRCVAAQTAPLPHQRLSCTATGCLQMSAHCCRRASRNRALCGRPLAVSRTIAMVVQACMRAASLQGTWHPSLLLQAALHGNRTCPTL